MTHIPIGLEQNGHVFFEDISRVGDLLIVGSNPTRKSIFVKQVLESMLLDSGQKDLKLVLADLQGNDFYDYRNNKNLFLPVIDNKKFLLIALDKLREELNSRMNLFMESNSNNFEDFKKSNTNLPRILCVIENFDSDDEIKDIMDKISLHGGTFGIHFIITLIRPLDSYIPETIRADFASRLSFFLNNKDDYERVFGEKLEGLSDDESMYYKSNISFIKKLKVIPIE